MKTDKTFKVKADGSMLTPEFRVSFPNVFQPGKLSGKYGLTMLFTKDTDFSVLEAAIKTKIKEKYPSGAPKGLLLPILDGEESDREEQKDTFYINAKSGKFRPGVVDQNRVEITDEAEFYPGCYARATITLYTWEYLGKKGVSVNLRNVQKLRDGEPLMSRVSAADEFDQVSVEAEDL
jgi:hypothetical protein